MGGRAASHVPAATHVYNVLKERIVAFQLRPGAPLPESELAAELNVSRTPVREALRMLKTEGLVEIVPGRGAQVAEISFQDVREAYEARILLEPALAARAALLMDQPSLRQLEALADAMPAHPQTHEDAMAAERADREFHELIGRASGSMFLHSLVAMARNRTQRVAFLVPVARYYHSREEHKAIVAAIRARDASAAEEAMRRHIIAARDRLLRGA